MDIIISNQSVIPLYQQISEQMKNLIVTGALEAGEIVPSIRGLAKELKVSIITTKRAYEELEAEGFIETLPGKGTYVSTVNLNILKEVVPENAKGYEIIGIQGGVSGISIGLIGMIVYIISFYNKCKHIKEKRSHVIK